MSEFTKTIFTDESLRYLYSSPLFQTLTEQQQLNFLQYFEQNTDFQKVLDVAIEVQQSVFEMEAIVPKMQEKDALLTAQMQQRDYLKSQLEQQDNVIFVPFHQKLKHASPFIVLLQQSAQLADLHHFLKGLILPLFDLCARQQRDLVIIPFNEEAGEAMTFDLDSLKIATFTRFLNGHFEGQAKLVPALEKALEIFEKSAVQCNPELFILTDNQLLDYEAILHASIVTKFQQQQVEISVIAMSEEQFDAKPIPYADKVYFANE